MNSRSSYPRTTIARFLLPLPLPLPHSLSRSRSLGTDGVAVGRTVVFGRERMEHRVRLCVFVCVCVIQSIRGKRGRKLMELEEVVVSVVRGHYNPVRERVM